MSWDNPSSGGAGGTGFDDGFGTASEFTNYSFSGYSANAGKTGGCYNCGESGHNKAECPVPRVFNGVCNGCGKGGHMSRECPNAGPMQCRRCSKEGHLAKDCDAPTTCARCGEGHYVTECPVPKTCNHCKEEGHIARDCPMAPPRLCLNCQEEGHIAVDCTKARKVDRSGVRDEAPERAIAMMKEAARLKDLEDVKEAFYMYVKSCHCATYLDMEELLRHEDIGLYLICIERQMAPTYTNMDLQGNLNKKYTVTFRFSPNPTRPREKAIWPTSPDENRRRLGDCGEPVDRGLPLCLNCRQLGHISKRCPQERTEHADRPTITCSNCGIDGHRMRDCKAPRVDKNACRNCGKSGHNSRECAEPRSAEGVECRKCNQVGHFSRDCPQGGGGDNACRNCGKEGHKARECTEPKNMAKMQCRNCDEFGHMSKDCSQPRNMVRVKCSNCEQMGHFRSACTNAPADGSLGGAAGVDIGPGDAADGW